MGMNVRKILIVLIIAAFLPAAALAAQQPAPYPSALWIIGMLDGGTTGLTDLSGFKIVFYQSPYQTTSYSDGYATASSDASAKYNANAHDDLNLLPLSAKTYYIGVVKRNIGGTDYGVNETQVAVSDTDLANGYKVVNLTIKEGEGIPDPEIIDLKDTGWIRNTQISREGQNLRLTWDYDPALGPTAVRIYVLDGADAEYAAVVSSFDNTTIPSVIASGTKQYLHTSVAFDGNNYYYRVVPDPLPAGTTILSDANNSITVGKVEIDLPANKYVFCALPFQSDNVSLMGILGEQIGPQGEFLWWDGTGYHGATYTTTSWTGTERALRIGEGFIVRAKTDMDLALVGRFGTLAIDMYRQLTADQYDLVAYPYPTSKKFADMGIAADAGSDLLRWKVDTQAYEGATYTTSWSLAIDTLELARPRYYRPKNDYNWKLQF